MKLLLKSLALFLGLAFASPALAFSYSCADWKDPDLRTDFWKEATRAIIADCVQDMGFAMGFSVKDRTDLGATPLHYAAAFASNPDVIFALVEAGADVNARDKIGRTPLHEAAGRNSNPDVVTTLLQAGTDVNARDKNGWTPLYYAAGRNSNPDIITTLLQAGADVNARNMVGSTPLHYAAWLNDNPDVITTLLQAGADVNARNKIGWTPLHFAARFATNPQVINVLLQAGADVGARGEDSRTPLHEAAGRNSNPDVVTTLLQAGTDVNARDKNGSTPLHEAARYNSNREVIIALLEAGAHGWTKDNASKTAFDLVEENEALIDTVYWALNDARFNKGVQTALVAPQESSSVPIFGPPMTGGEKDAFRLAVNACWIVEPGAEWARVIVTVGFSLGQDGRVIGDVRMINASGGNDAQTATAFQAARRAILRCQRSGYKLPPEKYQSWQNIEMTFDASGMRLR